MKYIVTLAVLAAIGVGAYYWLDMDHRGDTQVVTEPPTQDSVVAYVSQNLSRLSPIKETMGGTFYMTNIDFDRGSGTVDYEDGHNMYSAVFTYSFNERGGVKIESFEILE